MNTDFRQHFPIDIYRVIPYHSCFSVLFSVGQCGMTWDLETEGPRFKSGRPDF
jgi:hypothetical protein